MGRPAKPTAIKELSGNPGKRPLKKAEPKGKAKPKPPEMMTTLAQIVWKRLVAAMPEGVYTNTDENLLAIYCEAVARHWEAAHAYNQNPVLLEKGSTGQLVENPVVKIMRAQAQTITTLGSRLGLDPVSRQGLTPGDDHGEADWLN